MCALRFSRRISLDHWGYAVIDPAPIVSNSDLAKARRAVRACPVHALSLKAVSHSTRFVAGS